MDVRPKDVWTYDQRMYERTTKGCMDVRPKGAWTYVLRVYGRTSIEFIAEMLPQLD